MVKCNETDALMHSGMRQYQTYENSSMPPDYTLESSEEVAKEIFPSDLEKIELITKKSSIMINLT